MGLNFSHTDMHWSCSCFHEFRRKLAAEIGIDLDDMDGFEGTLSWDDLKDDIVPLLDHSDCEGVLTPEECRRVAPRLRQLVSSWPMDDGSLDKYRALELATAMERAQAENTNLVFC